VSDRTERHATIEIPVRTVRVELVSGHAPVTPVEVATRATIGTATDCDLVLTEPTVSRYHADVVPEGGGIRVRDLGSTNGIRCGALRIEDAIVPAGTVLELGRVGIRLADGRAARASISREEQLGALVARSVAMRRLVGRIEELAGREVPVLVEGPPGSGKELALRTMHERSPRAAEPFVVVDCGALAEGLAASELFGHERGAYTDARERRAGAFERAAGGTLLLDDVGALPTSVQPLLLGALERRTVRRLGGATDLAVRARVVATSATDLRRAVNLGRFRLDLFYRLAVTRVSMPSLAERIDDLPSLALGFLVEMGHGASHPLLAEPSIESLTQRDWPGNVRELRGWLESRAALGDLAEATETPPAETGTEEELLARLEGLPYKDARAELLRVLERAYCEHLARRAGGSVSEAGRLSGVDRSQLRQIAARAGVRLSR
jgi:DNA-binding NtrC family response regulator